MKKGILFCAIAVLFVSCISQPQTQAIQEKAPEIVIPSLSQDEAIKIVNSALNEIDALIKKYAKAKELRDVWKVVSKVIRDGRLTFSIYYDDNSILFGGAFAIQNDNKPVIKLSNGILSLYKYKPSVLMAIMMHELTHAYFYFTMGSKFLERCNDRKEKNWYEADAIHIEAVFIEECLKPNNYELSAFEVFLLDSWQNDNLDSACTVMTHESSEAILIFDRLTNTYLDDEITVDDAFAEIKEYALDLLEVLNNKKISKEFWAITVLRLNSWIYYFNRFLFETDLEELAFLLAEDIECVRLVYEMRDTITGVVDSNFNRAQAILDDVVETWEKSLQHILLSSQQAA